MLPNLETKQFAGNQLELTECFSFFNNIINNTGTDDNAKMCNLRTSVKGKTKAAIAGVTYSGALYHTALDILFRNFGRLQSVDEGPNETYSHST